MAKCAVVAVASYASHRERLWGGLATLTEGLGIGEATMDTVVDVDARDTRLFNISPHPATQLGESMRKAHGDRE